MSTIDIILGLVAILFPPIAVWVKRGICSSDSFINLCLCILGGIPGLLHAWYIIAKYPENSFEPLPDPESTPITYVFIQAPCGSPRAASSSQPNASYGATGPSTQSSSQQPNVTRSYGQMFPPEGCGSPGVPPTYAEAVNEGYKVQH